MPKETIDSRHFGLVTEQPAVDGNPATVVPIESTYLHIGWTKERDHCEVAVLNQGSPTEEGSGWFVQLDRAGINRAIKVLRTARDQAFGRDE